MWMPLKNGTVQQVDFNDNLNPWRNQFVIAPWIWGQDASAQKFIAFNERVVLRLSVDFFNVFSTTQ